MASDGKVSKTTSMFRMAYRVAIDVRAAPERIWGLLTTDSDFPRWNSTVVSIEGPVTLGRKLKVKVKTSDRTFTPTVTTFEAPKTMVWSDGMMPMFRGVRTYTLTPKGGGITEFAMHEQFTGLMLPMIRPSLPDFSAPFETYAADLKREAEKSA